MNSGIDDAHNLAWKLASAIQGTCGEGLLDSYTAERRRAALENLGNAVRSTWFMSPPSEGFRIMRDGALQLAEADPRASALINPRQSAAHVYSASPCITGQAGQRLVAGAVVPNLPLLRAGQYLHSVLAPCGSFTILVDGRRIGSSKLAELHEQDWGASATVVAIEPGSPQGLAAQDIDILFDAGLGPIMLVRPDEHVVGWADKIEGCEALFRVALGHQARASDEAWIEVEDAGSLVPPTNLEAAFQKLAVAVDDGTLQVDTPSQAAHVLTQVMASALA